MPDQVQGSVCVELGHRQKMEKVCCICKKNKLYGESGVREKTKKTKKKMQSELGAMVETINMEP